MLRNGMWVLGASVGLAMAGCGGGGGGGAQEAHEVAAAYQGPIQSSDVARGQVVYETVCMSCHGGGAPALEGIGWEPAAMRERVREGGGRMPAITASRLSDEDLEALLAYLTTNGAVTGEIPGGAEPAATDAASDGAASGGAASDEAAPGEADADADSAAADEDAY